MKKLGRVLSLTIDLAVAVVLVGHFNSGTSRAVDLEHIKVVNSAPGSVGPATTVSLNPGESAPLDLNSSTVITNLGTSSFALFGQRAEVCPAVTLVPTSTVNAGQASAEVFDTFTGRTWSDRSTSGTKRVAEDGPVREVRLVDAYLKGTST
jgi:hypothetical protein